MSSQMPTRQHSAPVGATPTESVAKVGGREARASTFIDDVGDFGNTLLTFTSDLGHKLGEAITWINPLTDTAEVESELRRQYSVENSVEYCVEINDPFNAVNLEKPSNKYVTSKYTIWNFLPLNLLEQFARVANFYFLIITILMLIPGVTPISPVTTIMPLVIILSVSAARAAVEDRQRALEDSKINHLKLKRVDPDNVEMVDVLSQELRVGDIILVEEGQEFPADLVLLASSRDVGTAFIDTANLDGETSLKLRSCVGRKDWNVPQPEILAVIRGRINCEQPNPAIESFTGNFDNGYGKKVTVSEEQLLLRGAVLRNTEWAAGAVVYVGRDTKLSLNLEGASFKFSRVEILLNRCVMFIFFMQTCVCLLYSGLARGMDVHFNKAPYFFHIDETYNDSTWAYIYDVFTWFILCSYLIPMNLYVLCEFAKYSMKFFIEWDHDLVDRRGDVEKGARVNVSTVVEELGQIQYILSDKTGTLTENTMSLKGMSASGVMLDVVDEEAGILFKSKRMRRITAGERSEPGEEDDGDMSRPSLDALSGHGDESYYGHEKDLILLGMCICSTATCGKEPGTFVGESPDEVALARAAYQNGIELTDRALGKCTVKRARGHDEWCGEYEVLAQLDFTSSRRRMHTLVRAPNGTAMLFCKGADSVMFDVTDPSSGPLEGETGRDTRHGRDINALRTHLSWFSQRGFRTLVVSFAMIEEDVLAQWLQKWNVVKAAVYDRAKQEEECFVDLEQRAMIIGCTAVEDRLQEGIQETLIALRDAGIQIAMLTGDKQETAINIGYNTGLMRMNHTLLAAVNFSIGDEMDTEARQRHMKGLLNTIERTCCSGSHDDDMEAALVIDGASTSICLENAEEKALLCQLMAVCKTAICNRMTPKQKAALVRLVKNEFKRVTLAVGDGANDVSMIREANVGVGIVGKEGMQAVNSADFALAQFKHLRKLLLVHGRYAYLRVTKTMTAAFFANLAFNIPIVCYGAYSGFSGQTLFSSTVMGGYNLIFTFCVQVHFVFLDRDVSPATLLQYPEAYRRLSEDGGLFNAMTFVKIFCLALWHAGLCFYITLASVNLQAESAGGHELNLFAFQMIWASSTVLGVVCHTFLQYNLITVYGVLMILADFGLYALMLWAYPIIYPTAIEMGTVATHAVFLPGPMLTTLFIIVASCLPVFAIQMFQRHWFTQPVHVLEEINFRGGPMQPRIKRAPTVLPSEMAKTIAAGAIELVEKEGRVVSEAENRGSEREA